MSFSPSIRRAELLKRPFSIKSDASPKCQVVVVSSKSTSRRSTANDSEESTSRSESLIANAKSFLPYDFDERKKTLFSATLSGLAVSLAMIPEAVAFSFVAGVSPLVGLWTTVILGFFAAAFGSGAGLVSSASGACSVVVASLGRSHGNVYLSACALLAGVLQAAGGVLGLGRLIRLIPHPCMLGFVNGLAIVMTKAQLHHFRIDGDAFMSLRTATGASMYGLTALTMLFVKLMPRLTKKIPPALGAVILSSAFAKFLKLPVQTLDDVAGASTFTGGLPKIALPAIPTSFETFKLILPFAATMAIVGCIESLVTLQIVDGMVDDGKHGSTSQECIGQGWGNIMSGLTGGIGGCALLGQSIINVQSGGGGSRWSGMSMSLFLACTIMWGSPLLASVPVASLVAIMLLICQATFSWSSLRIMGKIPQLDALIIVLVSILTVERDMGQALVVGTLLSFAGFAWKQSTRLNARSYMCMVNDTSTKVYKLNGPLFFGTSSQLSTLFDIDNDAPEEIIIDFSECRIYDRSALKAIQILVDRYSDAGKVVFLARLSKDSGELLKRLYRGTLPSTVEVIADPKNDPCYGIADKYDEDMPV